MAPLVLDGSALILVVRGTREAARVRERSEEREGERRLRSLVSALSTSVVAFAPWQLSGVRLNSSQAAAKKKAERVNLLPFPFPHVLCPMHCLPIIYRCGRLTTCCPASLAAIHQFDNLQLASS